MIEDLSHVLQAWESLERRHQERSGDQLPEDMRLAVLLSMCTIKLTVCSVSKSRIPFKLSSSSFMPLLWWHVFSSISLFATSVTQPLAVNAAQVEIPPNTSQDGFANHFPSNCDLASWCNPIWQQETAGKSSPHLGRTWAKAILKVEGRVVPTGNVFVAGLLAPLGDRIWVGTERFAAVGEGCVFLSRG